MSSETESLTPPVQTASEGSPTAVLEMPPSLTFVDLFAGAGGLTLGLMAAGLTHRLGVERDPFAVRSYETNTRAALDLDLSREDADEKILEVLPTTPDVVVGGPPCQGFSVAGKRDPNDPRSEMVFHFVRVAVALRPQFIVMENVPGIVSMGEVVPALVDQLRGAGFDARWRILRASDYGAATTRQRFILTAWRRGGPALTHPTGGQVPARTVRDVLFGEAGTLREPPQGFPNGHVPTRHKAATLERMRVQRWGEPLYESWSHSWVRLDPNLPAPTMMENHGGVAVHPTQDRVITPREMARIQGFPDDWIFHGPKSQILKQVGNSVPILLARAIGQTLMSGSR